MVSIKVLKKLLNIATLLVSFILLISGYVKGWTLSELFLNDLYILFIVFAAIVNIYEDFKRIGEND